MPPSPHWQVTLLLLPAEHRGYAANKERQQPCRQRQEAVAAAHQRRRR